MKIWPARTKLHRLKSKKIVILILAFFLVVRIILALFFGDDQLGGDSRAYNSFAVEILQNRDWLTSSDFLGHRRAPVYPLFIASIYKVFGVNNFTSIYIFQAILSTITCFFILILAEMLFKERIALYAFIWSGFYVFYLMYVRVLFRETLVIFLFIICFYYLYRHLNEGKKLSKHFWLFVITYFLLIHTDPRYLFYLPFLLILFLIFQPVKVGLTKYIRFIFILFILMVPWTIRNYFAFGQIAIITPKISKYVRYSIISDLPGASSEGEIRNLNYPTDAERSLVKSGLNPKGRSQAELDAIINDVYPASNPLRRILYNFVELWRPLRLSSDYTPFPSAHFVPRWSIRHNLASVLSYGILLPFMLIGICFLVKRNRNISIFLIFPFCVQSLLHVFQLGLYRYRIPIDAFIIIVAFYGLSQISSLIMKRMGHKKV